MNQNIEAIFCINTGRSGSHYISKIFDCVKSIANNHEMSPRGHDLVMRQYITGNKTPMKKIADVRLKKIHEAQKLGKVFIETSHHFIKGFGWIVPEHISQEKIGVIILTRKKKHIISSYMRLNLGPLTKQGRKLIFTPEMKNPLVKPPMILFSPRFSYYLMYSLRTLFRAVRFTFRFFKLPEPGFPAAFDEYNRKGIEWYVDEVAAKAEAFKNLFPNIHYYHITVEELNQRKNVDKLLEYFGLELESEASLDEIVGISTNKKLSSQDEQLGLKLHLN